MAYHNMSDRRYESDIHLRLGVSALWELAIYRQGKYDSPSTCAWYYVVLLLSIINYSVSEGVVKNVSI